MLNAGQEVAHDDLAFMLAGSIWRPWFQWPFHANSCFTGLTCGLVELAAAFAFSPLGILIMFPCVLRGAIPSGVVVLENESGNLHHFVKHPVIKHFPVSAHSRLVVLRQVASKNIKQPRNLVARNRMPNNTLNLTACFGGRFRFRGFSLVRAANSLSNYSVGS